MPYVPGVPPGEAEGLQHFLREELNSISQHLGDATELDLREVFVEPPRPRTGMIVFADGTSWDPGQAVGLYVRMPAGWEALMLGSRNLAELADPGAAATALGVLKLTGGTLTGDLILDPGASLTLSGGNLDVTGTGDFSEALTTTGNFTVNKVSGVAKFRSGSASTQFTMQFLGQRSADGVLVAHDYYNIQASEANVVFQLAVRRSGANNVAELRFNWGSTLVQKHTFKANGDVAFIGNQTITGNLTVTGSITSGGAGAPIALPHFTVAGLPSPSPAGQLVWVTDDATVGAIVAHSTGTQWNRIGTGIAIS